jgi:hypothetical protein
MNHRLFRRVAIQCDISFRVGQIALIFRSNHPIDQRSMSDDLIEIIFFDLIVDRIDTIYFPLKFPLNLRHLLPRKNQKEPRKIFSTASSNRNLPVDLEVDNFQNNPLKTKESILKYPELKNMFIRYNTALPSSASVERLFQPGG